MRRYRAHPRPGYNYLWVVYDMSVTPPVIVWPVKPVTGDKDWATRASAKRMARQLSRRDKK